MTPPTLDEVLRTRFRELREQSGLTQTALARVATSLGMPWTRAHVAAIEAGERSLSFPEVLLVAQRIFKVNWDEMVATDAALVLLAPDAAIRGHELPSLCRLEARRSRIYRMKLGKSDAAQAAKARTTTKRKARRPGARG